MPKVSFNKNIIIPSIILGAIPLCLGLLNWVSDSVFSIESITFLSGLPFALLAIPAYPLALSLGIPIVESDNFAVVVVSTWGIIFLTAFYFVVGILIGIWLNKSKFLKTRYYLSFFWRLVVVLSIFGLITNFLFKTLPIPCSFKLNIQSYTEINQLRDKCYVEKAILPDSDNAVCDKIITDDLRYRCYKNLAISKGLPELCEQIYPQDDYGGGNQERNFCYYEVALKKQDPNICKNIKRAFYTDEDTVSLKNDCLSLNAKQKGWNM